MRRHLAVCCLALLPLGILRSAGPDTSSADERIIKETKVATDDAALVDYLRKRTVNDTDATKIRSLIKQLGDDNFSVREKATEELTKLGSQAEAQLRQALTDTDIEVVRRAEDCLRLIKSGAGASVDAAVIRLLALRKPAGAAEALLGYLPFSGNHLVADELKMALVELARSEAKSVAGALQDKLPARRAAAAFALCHAGMADHYAAVRKLLQDPETSVRLEAALALAQAQDKEAVRSLIDLLPQLTPSQAWQAEDVLFRMAGAHAPPITLGSDDTAKKKARDAWVEWWDKNKAKVDLAALETSAKTLGNTMFVLLDAGKVLEVDAKGKVLWEVDDIQFPLDAQYLPDDRLLVAEHAANRVTERDRKTGQVRWKKDFSDGPLVAQRLANGNTFIATRADLYEYDPAGKQVWTYTSPVGDNFRKVQKQPNGDIVMVTSSMRYVRMSPAGKQLQSFAVDVHTNGGRLDVMPNGHVLVPQKDSNKIVEYDAEGKVVWEAAVDEPVAAIRLPNGHTLVTTLNQRRAVELDGTGKEVWEYKVDTRITRAWRR